MKKNKISILFLSLVLAFTLIGCNNQTETTEETTTAPVEETETDSQESESSHMDHSAEEMSSDGVVPEDLTEAENPTYPVGSNAIIRTDHMMGMDGAEATITGAYNTTVYTVSYTPENGEPVEDHKWVVHEELENPGEEPLNPGDEVVLLASHMEGMEGSTATIDSAEETTVYMVDFVTTDTNEQVSNHKWVTEAELEEVQ